MIDTTDWLMYCVLLLVRKMIDTTDWLMYCVLLSVRKILQCVQFESWSNRPQRRHKPRKRPLITRLSRGHTRRVTRASDSRERPARVIACKSGHTGRVTRESFKLRVTLVWVGRLHLRLRSCRFS